MRHRLTGPRRPSGSLLQWSPPPAVPGVCSRLNKNALTGQFPPVLLRMTWLQQMYSPVRRKWLHALGASLAAGQPLCVAQHHLREPVLRHPSSSHRADASALSAVRRLGCSGSPPEGDVPPSAFQPSGGCRNVTFNMFEGDVTPLAAMNLTQRG